VHVSETGEKAFTVRAAAPRLMSVEHIREICDIADQHCNGYLRFTTRNNIEFILEDEAKAKALKKELDSRKHIGGSFKFPTGGTGMGCPISSIPRDGFTAIRPPPMRQGP